MKLIYVNKSAPLKTGLDLDPRRMNLYGKDILWISPTKLAATPTDHVSNLYIGDIYLSSKFQAIFLLVHQRHSFLKIKPLIEFLGNCSHDTVPIVGCHFIAYALACEKVPFIFDPTDSQSLFYLRRFQAIGWNKIVKKINSLRLHLLYKILERKIVREASATIITGYADETYLKAIEPDANICRVMNGTDYINDNPVRDISDGLTIGFHGGMTWEPNRMTALRLASTVAQRLSIASDGKIKISIAGQPVPPDLMKFHGKNGVEVCGFVPDIKEWMSKLSIYVMPMYSGAGIKNKLIEALAMGMPVITNVLGAETLGSEAESIVEVVRNDQELVTKIIELLNNKKKLCEMRISGRKYAEKHFHWEIVRARFLDILLNSYKR